MKTFFTTFIFSAACFVVSAQTSVSHNPAAMQSQPAIPPPGGTSWVSPNNAMAHDNSYAFATMSSYGMCMNSNCYFTEGLKASGFGFNIPLTASITGIEVQVNRYASVTTYVQDSEVKLTLNGALTGTNYANPTAWGTASAYATYGGPTDLWNTVLTPSNVNTGSFGVSFKAYNYMNNVATAYVDHMLMKVYYVEACTGLSLTATGISNETTTGANNGHAQLNMSGTGPYAWASYQFSASVASGSFAASPYTTANLSPGNWKYIITDAHSCKDSVAFFIDSAPTPTVVTPTAIKGYEKQSGFSVYPNPSSGDITLELKDLALPATVIIYDITGSEALVETLNDKKQVLNTARLPKGVYSIRVSDKKTQYRSRFIRE